METLQLIDFLRLKDEYVKLWVSVTYMEHGDKALPAHYLGEFSRTSKKAWNRYKKLLVF